MNQEMEEIPDESLSRVKEIVNSKLNIQYPTFNEVNISKNGGDEKNRRDNISDLHSINEQVEQLGKVLSSLQKHVGQKIAMRESEERLPDEEDEDEKQYRKRKINNSKLRKKVESNNNVRSSEDEDYYLDKSEDYSNNEKIKKERHSKKKNTRKIVKSFGIGSNSRLKIYTVKKNVDKSQLRTNSYIKRNNTFHDKISLRNNGLSKSLRTISDTGQYVIKSYAGLDKNTKLQNINASIKRIETSKKCSSNSNKSLLHIMNKKGKYTTKGEYFSNDANCSS